MTIRGRLTLWYALALSVMLLAFGATAYLMLQRHSQRRIDESLEETARAFAAAWLVDPRSTGTLPERILNRYIVGDLEIAVLDRSLSVVARAPSRADGRGLLERAAAEPLATLVREVAGAGGVRGTLPGLDQPRRAFALRTNVAGREQVIVVAQGLRERNAMLRDTATSLTLVGVLLLGAAVLGGYVVAVRALAPLASLATQAQHLGPETAGGRLHPPNEDDELGRLARAFNALLGRLDDSLRQQRDFMADASHELRTPLAIVRGEADVALARDRPAKDYRDSLRVIGDEARQMSRLVDDLLLLARSHAGAATLAPTDLYLDELVAECVRAVRSIALDQGVTVIYEAPREMPARGDEALLRRMFMNLLDNAIKHGGRGSSVAVRALRSAGVHEVTVRDTGPGIPPDAQPRVFERFARGANRTTRGAGLGLAIARQIASMHGGTLHLVDSRPGHTVFRFAMPAADM